MSNSSDDRWVHLQQGLVVPVEAYITALDVERAGHHLVVESEHLYLDRGHGLTLDAELVARVRQWRHHVLVLMRYHPNDRHLVDAAVTFPDHGPIVRRS